MIAYIRKDFHLISCSIPTGPTEMIQRHRCIGLQALGFPSALCPCCEYLVIEFHRLNAEEPRVNARTSLMHLVALVAADVKGAIDKLSGAKESLRKGQPQDRIMAVVVSDRINKVHESLAVILDYLRTKGPEL